MNKKLAIFLILFSFSQPIMAKESFALDERSGNQNEACIQDAIPSGDALREAVWLATELDKATQAIDYKTDSSLALVKRLITMARDCSSTAVCHAICEEQNNEGCSCQAKPAQPEKLCDLKTAEEIYSRWEK